MVCHQAYDHLRNHFLLGPSTSGLCYGLSTISNQDGHLYGAATRDSNQAENSKEHVLKLEKNVYGQKQAGHVWNSFLVDKLTSIGFTTSQIDDCIFFRSDVIFMVYVDDGIFLGSDDSQLQEVIKEI
jgi:hypothetical protein